MGTDKTLGDYASGLEERVEELEKKYEDALEACRAVVELDSGEEYTRDKVPTDMCLAVVDKEDDGQVSS